MLKIAKTTVLLPAVFLTVFFFPHIGSTQNQAGYAGWKSCMACHKKITQSWQQTPHAKAIESLTKTSQETLPGCVSCHVTAYEEPGGYVDLELTPELADVQCEECHGSAKSHIGNIGGKTGMVAQPGNDKCRKCHTPGQDPKFNYEQKIKKVHLH